MSDEEPALVLAIKNNYVTLVADPSHRDGNIPASIKSILQQANKDGNLTDLLIEADTKQRSLAEIRNDGEFGKMVVEAEKLGIRVHLIDDRSRQIERDRRFPDEAAYVAKTDPYATKPEKLISTSANPDKMRAYLAEKAADDKEDMAFRNQRMAENIDAVIKQYPNGKKLALIGAAHLGETNDIDELLRAKGHQTITVEVNSPYSAEGNLMTEKPDKPDFVIAAETGKALSYKDIKSGQMRAAFEGVELPWKNTEPVANLSRSNLSSIPPSSASSAPAPNVQLKH